MNLSNEGSLDVITDSKTFKFAHSAWLFCFPLVFVFGIRFCGGFFSSVCSSPSSCIRENNPSLRMQGASHELQSSFSIAEVCFQETPGTACFLGCFQRDTFWGL